jgi:branched-chain amino acid transport system substrate-binding protein
MKDKKSLASYAGLHSPPIFANLDVINENKNLKFVPWAAGGGITRGGPPNYVFRLSLDDKYADKIIIDYGVEERGLKKFAICVIDDQWGNWNSKNMINRIEELKLEIPKVYLLPHNISLFDTKVILRKIGQTNADGILLVAHAGESVNFVKGMVEIEDKYKLPILSHWGVTANYFVDYIKLSKDDEDYLDISKVDLNFIQSSFSFSDEVEKNIDSIMDDVKKLYPEVKEFSDIQPPTGFIQAYDLTLILIEAAKQAELTGDVNVDKIKLHYALENLENPVRGLIKTYDVPFSEYSKENDDAHEALNENDFIMVKFDESGKIIQINKN